MINTSERIAGLSPEEKRTLLAKLLRKKAAKPQSLYPLSYGQRALWFLYQLEPESASYNIASAWSIRSDLDVPALRRAFQRLVDRHPTLRTTFTLRNGEPVQQVHDYQEINFEETDASTWSGGDLEKILAAEERRPFDL